MESKPVWRFIPYAVYDPYMNMAIDEAILIAHSEHRVLPTVRFYGWNPATLSLGYFQKAETEVDFAAVESNGIGLVRRPTGGRAVLHDDELTYSIIVSEQAPGIPTSVVEAYRVLSEGLVSGFKRLGLQAEMVSLAGEEEKRRAEALGSAACFDSPSWYELVVEGRKVAGSAQTRQKGAVLQHGSILINHDTDLLFRLLRFPNEKIKERLKQKFADKAVTINAVKQEPTTIDEVQDAFFHGFAEGLQVELVEAELTPYEMEIAEKLVKEKYATSAWNFKR